MNISYDEQRSVGFVLNEKVQRRTSRNIAVDKKRKVGQPCKARFIDKSDYILAGKDIKLEASRSKSLQNPFLDNHQDENQENQHNADVVQVSINDAVPTYVPRRDDDATESGVINKALVTRNETDAGSNSGGVDLDGSISDVQSYEIVICTEPFSTYVKQELSLMEADNLPKEDVLSKIGPYDAQMMSIDGSYHCNICDKRFEKKIPLRQHIYQEHNIKPTTLTPNAEKLYVCQIDNCGQAFKSAFGLKVHYRTHTGEKPYKCDLCDMSYTVKSTLKIHKRTHTGEKPYKCDVCDKYFISAKYRKNHIMWHHSNVRPYVCDFCGHATKTKVQLKTHKLIHSDEKPFKCDECGNCFRRRDDLVKHSRNHTLEKPYQCHLCGANYKRSDQLKKHSISHTR